MDSQRRAGWYIVIGLALAAVSVGIAIFAIGRGDDGAATLPSPTSMTAAPTTGDIATTPPTRPTPDFGPTFLPGPPVQQPSTVTVTAPGPTVLAAPSSSGGVSNTATTVAAITALVGAITGLLAAATGLVKVLRREPAPATPASPASPAR